MSLTGKKDQADDLVQETFMKAMCNIALLNTLPKPQLRSWLYKVLKNCLIDRKRKERFEVLSEPEEDGDTAGLEEKIGSKLLAQQALSLLSQKNRDILYMRYILSMNSSQIAYALDIPASTVRYRIHAALNLLRNKYKKTLGGNYDG